MSEGNGLGRNFLVTVSYRIFFQTVQRRSGYSKGRLFKEGEYSMIYGINKALRKARGVGK